MSIVFGFRFKVWLAGEIALHVGSGRLLRKSCPGRGHLHSLSESPVEAANGPVQDRVGERPPCPQMRSPGTRLCGPCGPLY